MKTGVGISIFLAILLLPVCAQADTTWTSGHHEIYDNDVYGEIWMYNDATATMSGGDVYKLGTLGMSVFDMIY